MHYVIADIHGCRKQFLELLEKIKFSENDTLYILGDVLDRGFDPIGTLQDLMGYDNIVFIHMSSTRGITHANAARSRAQSYSSGGGGFSSGGGGGGSFGGGGGGGGFR